MCDRDTPFTDEEHALLASIASHAAVALEHGRAVMRGVVAQDPQGEEQPADRGLAAAAAGGV